ncbi:MAG: GspE/PulE family protein, partial [Desulfobacterales bacterium]|nr:GspE/PulE family protein [Desulfobacterales bacterium]
MIQMPYGMILCTGPTGSGKSTSLFAMLKEINTPDTNIITLEDPVEYRMAHIRQVQLNHRAGMTFASGLRSILRQDPDVIMIGEIRDTETAAVAVQAALTGHLVFSTVHTNDAAGAITRFVDMGVEPFMVASVMLVTIAQRLVRRVCPHCKEPYTPDEDQIKFWGLKPKRYTFFRAKGCHQCLDTGYKGRVGFFEILYVNDNVRHMILEGRSAQEITRLTSRSGQLKSLKFDAVHKVVQGVTTSEEAMSAILIR